ncbi:MAG: thioredoxin family protein [Methanomassiliicoccales archaeon]|nr:thioredoxin family protein [Methanomassiliicoccales archaeon]
MKIEISGTGLGIQAEAVKVEDLQALMDRGAMAISAGRILKKEEMKRMLTGAGI